MAFLSALWNTNHPLIIDPILSYSKRLGGDINYTGGDLAIDDEGHLYVLSKTYRHAGNTETDAVAGPCFEACQADVLISKFSADRKTLLWKTTLAGNSDDDGRSLKVDDLGHIYVAGWTSSDDFPRRRAHDWSFSGESEGFLTKLTSAGKSLSFSTFVGNDESEMITSMDIASDGSIYVAGRSSRTVADEKKLQASIDTNGFIHKYSKSGRHLLFSQQLGGKDYDTIESIAVSDHTVYVVGSTDSQKWHRKYKLGDKRNGASDGFITALSPKNGQTIYTKLLGGNQSDIARSVHVSEDGGAVVAGITNSSDFPKSEKTKFDPSGTYDWDAFVSKFSPDGDTQWTQRLSGSNNDYVSDVIIDENKNIYLAGYTYSDDLQGWNSRNSWTQDEADLFVSKLSPDGSAIAFTQKLGGMGDDRFANIVKSPRGELTVSGISFHGDQQYFGNYQLPQPDFSNSGNLFFAKVTEPLLYPIFDQQWTPLALPFELKTNTDTVAGILSDDISGHYGEDWFVYLVPGRNGHL